MTQRIEHRDLPEVIRREYDLLEVRKITIRTNKSGARSCKIITYKGREDEWRSSDGGRWVKADE